MTGKQAAAGPVFTAADARLEPSWPADRSGVVVIVDARTRWFAAREPELEAAAAASWPRVTAVSLAPAGADPARVGLAAVFAAHLARVRRERRDRGDAFITAAGRPTPPKGWVRVAHLVTLATPDLVDELVWEILPHQEARRWIGRHPARSGFVEAHLPGLVRLRAALRSGRLASTPTGRALAEALHGRDLSTGFVYDHVRLVSRALRELTRVEDHAAQTPWSAARITPAGLAATSGAVHR